MPTPSPEVFVRDSAVIAEGPVIDERSGELVWVDIPRGELHRASLSDPENTHRTQPVGMSLGAVGVRAAGGFVAACADGLGTIDDAGTLSVVHEIIRDPGLRMNDAKCDPAGRFWAGSTALDFEAGRGALHCWDGTNVTTVRTGLALPNGLGWSPDGRLCYFIDTKQSVLFRADFDVDDGVLGPLAEFVRFDSRESPDGLCVDADGHLWVAIWGGSEVRRFDPAGRQVVTVAMPVSQPSSCAFGPEGTLYITTASEGVDEPLAGSVFALPTSQRGVPVAAFAG